MKINFLDQNITNELTKGKNKIDEHIFNVSSIDWPDVDGGYIKLITLNSKEINEIKSALAFFIKENQKKAFKKIAKDDPFKLASNFMGIKDIRYYLNYIYSNGQNLIASNGHILISIDHKVNEGFYTKEGILTEFDAKYPDFNKVFNQSFDEPININSGIEEQKTAKLTYVNYKNQKGIVQAFDKIYIDKLKKLGVEKIQLFNGSMFGLYFESSEKEKLTYTGIIMGLRT